MLSGLRGRALLAGSTRPSRRRRVAVALSLLAGAVLLGGCNLPTFGGYRGATTQARDEFKLWSWMVIAGIIVAAIVYALIVWASFAYLRKRRGEDHIPRQFHKNVPLEIVYTVIPVIICAGIFFFTVLTENNVDAVTSSPGEIVHVLAYRWGWRFTYYNSHGTYQGVRIQTAAEPELLAQPATSKEYPQLVLPKGENVRIVLSSEDVIHGFYIPEFNFSRYAQPGVTNVFDFTPTTAGIFRGQCSQFCGLYHAEMLFSVRVVSSSGFTNWLQTEQTTQAQNTASA